MSAHRAPSKTSGGGKHEEIVRGQRMDPFRPAASEPSIGQMLFGLFVVGVAAAILTDGADDPRDGSQQDESWRREYEMNQERHRREVLRLQQEFQQMTLEPFMR